MYTNIDFLVDINNWCYNQELCNEKRVIFICCLYNVVALSMLDEFAFMRRKKVQILIFTFMFWKSYLQNVVILAYNCVIMHFLTARFRL